MLITKSFVIRQGLLILYSSKKETGHKSLSMKRIVIYPSDIRMLTDKSESYARKEIQSLKRALNKEVYQKVTIKEYCRYYGLNEEEVLGVLSKSKLNDRS